MTTTNINIGELEHVLQEARPIAGFMRVGNAVLRPKSQVLKTNLSLGQGGEYWYSSPPPTKVLRGKEHVLIVACAIFRGYSGTPIRRCRNVSLYA